MTFMGFVILLICFAGPLLPPLIGTVVGTAYDALKTRRNEGIGQQARQSALERQQARRASASGAHHEQPHRAAA